MSGNFILLFIRNLRRQKLFSTINLLGLTVSMVSTILIYLYVQHEFSHDRFHNNAEHIYRVNQTFIWGENSKDQFASTGPGVAYALKEELPEIELITSIHTPGNFIMSYSNPKGEVLAFEEDRVLAADSNFFSMFNFPLLAGNASTVFDQANTMVMTATCAKKYFGEVDPIGKLIRVGGTNGEEPKTYEITGIVAETPDNSYIEFDVLLSMKSFPPVERFYWSWVWTQLETFVRLDPQANVDAVREKVANIPSKHLGETMRRVFNMTFEEYIKSGKQWELFIQPMTSIHLPEYTVLNRLNDSGNLTVIYSFIGAAIFIVLLSCVNFMNLSTAQFTRRVKEASVRKILGLGKGALSLQYFTEAFIFCIVALAIALALTQVLLPLFNLITDKQLQLNLFNNLPLVAGMLGLVLLMTLLSGSYPALFLSSFNPVEAMKGKLKVGREGKTFRNALVIFQFSVSIILMICTAIVFQQLNYVADKDLGFNRDNVLVIEHVEALSNGESFAQASMNITGVANATWCNSVPPRIWGGDTFSAEGNNELRIPINFTGADEQYLTTLDIQVKYGRNFSKDIPADVNRVILNESAIKRIGWTLNDSVIGKRIYHENNAFEIAGVVADYNYWSLANPIEPMAIFHIKTEQIYPEKRQLLALRINAQDAKAWEQTIADMQNLWKKHAIDTPFEYFFIDQAFAETFRSQQQFGKVLTVMAFLAILIASLGLLGMIIYALEQRTKEIGIRKVSGASVFDILSLISRSYTTLISIAFVLGAPVSYFLMSKWLESFAFRIQPSAWIFIGAGASTFCVAILITSYHAMKAARQNPIEVLKDE